jgi:hypothetical protein
MRGGPLSYGKTKADLRAIVWLRSGAEHHKKLCMA